MTKFLKFSLAVIAISLLAFTCNSTKSQTKLKQNFKWEILETEAYRGKQDDITFVDRNTGWYVNGFGKIFHTKDGGKTWEKQLEQKGSFFRTLAFIDENIGFVGTVGTVGTDYYPNVTDSIPLYGTTDGGKTWKPVNYDGPYVKGLCGMDVVKEEYINQGVLDIKYHIYAVGRVGIPASFMVSHDSGKTWTSKSMMKDCKMLYDIKMFNKDEGIVCASTSEKPEDNNALILKTYDGGNTWKKVYQSDRPYEGTWKASFPTNKVGYVTIQSYNRDPNVVQQRLAKTIDGGETWIEIDLVKDNGARQFGVGFIDENHGYIGTYSIGYKTIDGGQSWSRYDLGAACNKIRIYRDKKDEVYGYAIGVNVFKLKLETINQNF